MLTVRSSKDRLFFLRVHHRSPCVLAISLSFPHSGCVQRVEDHVLSTWEYTWIIGVRTDEQCGISSRFFPLGEAVVMASWGPMQRAWRTQLAKLSCGPSGD